MARRASEIISNMVSLMPTHLDMGSGSILRTVLEAVASEMSEMEEKLEELIMLNGLNAPVTNFATTPIDALNLRGWGPSSLPGVMMEILQDRAVEEMNDAGDEAPADPIPTKPTRKSMAYWSD